MPRFVILEHDHPHLHWDFMLEEAGVLVTWRLSQAPGDDAVAIRAEKIADHRLAYLDYEGPLTGRRGSVVRWDAGGYVEKSRRNKVRLEGGRWRGDVELRQDDAGWELTFIPVGGDNV